MSEYKELEDLIHSTEAAGADKPAMQVPKRKSVAGIPVALWFLVIVGVVAYGGFEAWQFMAPPSRAQVGADLKQAVDVAQRAVEEARRRDGTLPQSLPSSALAGWVRYEVRANEYRLTAAADGVRVVRDWGGSVTTEESKGK